MKKIVGIIAAVAMAASVFAFDWSGALKTSNTVFTADGTGVNFFQQNGLDNGGAYWGTRLQVAVYGDKCGALFALGAPKSWNGVNFEMGLFTDWKIWIDPIEQVRINLGENAGKYKVGGDRPQDWMYIATTADLRITTEIKPFDGLEIDFGITPSNPFNGVVKKYQPVASNDPNKPNEDVTDWKQGFWITIGNDGSFSLSNWGLAVNYKISDDIGTIGFVAYSSGVTKNNLNDMVLGLGYDGKIGDDIILRVAADINVAPTVSNIRGNVFFQAKFDDLTLAAFAMVANSLTANAPVVITPWLKVSYALTDDVTIYLGVNDLGSGQASIKTADPAFTGITVNPGITWKIGAADLETRLNILIPGQGGQFSMEMPLSVTVGL